MCTVVVSFVPDSPVPVLLVGVRDEFLDRPWAPPARHWPDWPELYGGRDLRAGGTWLAADPGSQRVACVLNGQGDPAPEAVRRSRGDLPLVLAGGGELPEPSRYDPCHLVAATRDSVTLTSWNGRDLARRDLPPGLHFVVNSGLEAAEPGPRDMADRIAHFRPRLLAATRPQPLPGAGDTAAAWGDWLPIIDGDRLDPADPRAMILRRVHRDTTWGTSSVSLIALTDGGLRYDFIDKTREHGETVVIG